MGAAPEWKVFNADGEYVAACKEIEGAAVLADFYGNGSKIKHEHRLTVWTEGAEDQPAAESWDHVATTAYARVEAELAKRKAIAARAAGPNPDRWKL